MTPCHTLIIVKLVDVITGAIEKQTRPDNINFDYESCDNFRVCEVKTRKTIKRQFSL